MINKKGFVARDFVVASLIFSGLIALFVLSVGALADDYDNPNVIDPEFAENFDKFEENTERISSMYEEVTSEEGLSFIGTFEVLFASTFSVISLVFTGLTSIGTQLLGFGEYFGIPRAVSKIFFTLLISSLTALIIFIIISSVNRRDL